jgi:hypothetical protein
MESLCEKIAIDIEGLPFAFHQLDRRTTSNYILSTVTPSGSPERGRWGCHRPPKAFANTMEIYQIYQISFNLQEKSRKHASNTLHSSGDWKTISTCGFGMLSKWSKPWSNSDFNISASECSSSNFLQLLKQHVKDTACRGIWTLSSHKHRRRSCRSLCKCKDWSSPPKVSKGQVLFAVHWKHVKTILLCSFPGFN